MLRDIIGHEDIKNKLKNLSRNPPKVLLFSGPSGVGKKFTALNYIDEIYNGYLNKKIYTHPDIFIFDPQGKNFKLELVNKMKSYMNTSPFELRSKHFILNNVDMMNKESANACLKVLEDVPDYINIILLADNNHLVLDTLKSRSINFNFSPIKNLKNYYPNLTDLQLKIVDGCPGKIEEIKDVDIDYLFDEINYLIKNFNNLDYFEIINWCVKNEKNDHDILNKLMFIAVEKLFLDKESDIPFNQIIHFLKIIKEKNQYYLNQNLHLKSTLIEAKHSLSKIN